MPPTTMPFFDERGRWPANLYYEPKASTSEREEGLDDLEPANRSQVTGRTESSRGIRNPRAGVRRVGEIRNVHPTVKPVGLIRWLVRLVTPPGRAVFDPFVGSGTTLVAAELEGVPCIAYEREPAYCDIARTRVASML